MKRLDLVSDCARCFGLCCTALPFRRGADFAFDKRPDDPCRNLDDAFACSIHTTLRADGMTGCTVFECFGAGQHVSQQTYGGVSWRAAPETASEMYAVFARVRDLHELLVLLAEAAELGADVEDLHDDIAALAGGDPDTVLDVDPFALRDRVGPVLEAVSRQVRAPGADLRHADLAGADLRERDLTDADLRGSLLVGADLRGVDVGRADLLGADLRGARVDGADLSRTLFLLQPQVNAARGSAITRLPDRLGRPGHWS
jgi:uncharacterized protein YjbI with pentapeptide repeats